MGNIFGESVKIIKNYLPIFIKTVPDVIEDKSKIPLRAPAYFETFTPLRKMSSPTFCFSDLQDL